MAATPLKKSNKAPKSLLESADVPIQFGVPTQAPVAVEHPVAVQHDTPVLLDSGVLVGDESAPGPETFVEVVADGPLDAATMTTAAIAPVELDIAPADLPPTDPQTAPPTTQPEPQTTQATKGYPMDETLNTMNGAASTMTNAATKATETFQNAAQNAASGMQSAASDMQARGTAMMGDMNTRAKSAVERGTKAVEELVEFQKGNMEAMMSSSRVAANGAQEIAKYSAEYGRSTIEKANATARQFATVKSPTEFFQLQGEIAKQTLDALVAEGAKFTESYMKLMGEVAQPLSNRAAEAVDKVKTIVGNQS